MELDDAEIDLVSAGQTYTSYTWVSADQTGTSYTWVSTGQTDTWIPGEDIAEGLLSFLERLGGA